MVVFEADRWHARFPPAVPLGPVRACDRRKGNRHANPGGHDFAHLSLGWRRHAQGLRSLLLQLRNRPRNSKFSLASSGRRQRPHYIRRVKPQYALALLTACTGATPIDPGHEYPTPLAYPAAEGDPAGPLMPLPHEVNVDPAKVALGEALFADVRLSGDGKVACNDCHALDKGGASGMAFSNLPDRDPVDVNVPSIFNAALNFRFGWSGKFREVGEQLDVAMTSPRAMAGTWKDAAAALMPDTALRNAFAAIYPEGLTPGSLRDAMVAHSLSLVTPDSRFDRFLAGEEALSPQEQRGYAMFRDYGCVSCHQGVNVGGNMYQRFGVMRDYFAERGNVTKADLGLYATTQDEQDRFVFRVPSLRNVARTAPYFHDASAATLPQAVQTMARYQLGRELTRDEAEDITAFLGTLTGTYRGKAL